MAIRNSERPPPSSKDDVMLFNVETLEAPVTRSFTDPETLMYLAAVEEVGWRSEQACSQSEGPFTWYLN
jgi:hypothetical protein